MPLCIGFAGPAEHVGPGSFVPALVGVMAASVGLGRAMGFCAAGAHVLVLIAAALLPETRGQELASS